MLSVGAHFKLSVPRCGVKKDIKQVLLEKLIELGILVNPDATVTDVSLQEGPGSAHGACVFPVSLDRTEEEAVLATPLDAQVDPEAPPATLPCFEPFSPESNESSSDAKLQVCLLCLQLEAQKDNAHDADYDLWLQIQIGNQS